jgi:hydrogenase expression/formation protein HypE
MSGGPEEKSNREILLAHGSGGRMTHDLVRDLFLAAFNNPALAALEDSARVDIGGTRIAFTTDSFVVSPILFPGGDVGKLAVCGTVNDLAVSGARPIALSAGFLLEEGLDYGLLEGIVASMRRTSEEVGVPIVTGDTKVVERGGLDRIFINTAGIGVLEPPLPSGAGTVRPGDRILVSGPLADHGMAVISARNDLRFDTTIESDCAPLWDLIHSLLIAVPTAIRWMRDPTRGGFGTVLNELVGIETTDGRQFGIEIEEGAVPFRPEVRALSEILGIDPIYVACEGRVVIVVAEEEADRALASLRSHPLGIDAAIVARVVVDPPGRVVMRTRIGGRRIIDVPAGEQLPRIC